MAVEVFQFGARGNNLGFLIQDVDSKQVGVIDVPDYQKTLDALYKKEWNADFLLITHTHADHIDRLPEFKKATNCKIYASHRAGLEGLVDVYVKEADEIAIGETVFKVLETPGHCADHVVYYSEDNKVAFVGDVLFSLGCGRLFGSDHAEQYASLVKLKGLLPETLIYCGHDMTLDNSKFVLSIDPDNDALKKRIASAEKAKEFERSSLPALLRDELAANPFLRTHDTDFGEQLGMGDQSPFEIFKALRDQKDNFKG